MYGDVVEDLGATERLGKISYEGSYAGRQRGRQAGQGQAVP